MLGAECYKHSYVNRILSGQWYQGFWVLFILLFENCSRCWKRA